MKQQILYILMIITALYGKGEMVFGQSNVEGYKKAVIDLSTTSSMDWDGWEKYDKNTYVYKCNEYVTFKLYGNNGLSTIDFMVSGLYNSGEKLDATLSWNIKDGYYISVTTLSSKAYHSTSGQNPTHSINGASVVTGGITKKKATTATSSNINLHNGETAKVTLGLVTSYIINITSVYNISHYELDITALESAISAAKTALSSITDETIKGYLETAITNANSFKAECAFPKSYWNGSPVGKTPADVTAITNYLSAYQNALTTIATAENSFDKTYDQETLTADIENAKTQLKLATDVNGINTALANIKGFDNITFNAESEIEEEATLPNPAASAKSGKVITYESSDDTIIEIDGTTLKALKPGTVTITAKTATGDGYYGYTTTKEFTVTPKAVILYPDKKCTIVPYITYPEITLERSFSAKKHYTLTLPFDSNISDIGGDYAAQLALVTYNKADGYTLYFQKVTDGQMVANQPYIVYAENGFNEFLNWTNITVAETIEAKGVSNDRTQGWTMQGNYTPGVNMEGNYGIAGGKFCLGTEKSSINAYTAYFTFLGTEKLRARVAVMDEGGNTTYIGELKDLDGNAAEEVFGIDGMRLPEMRKGINIVRQKDGSVRKIVK